MEEEKNSQSDLESIQKEITLNDLRNYLEDEKPPTDDKEDIGIDNDAIDYSLNSSISDEEETPNKSSGNKVFQRDQKKDKEGEIIEVGDQNISFDDMKEIISKPYAEMPEFYPGQLEFDPVEGLPGAQKVQLEHKKKSVLKNKYWEKILKNVYEIGTAEVPRPEHLIKILSLYIINQEKLKNKRKEQTEAKNLEMERNQKPKPDTTRIIIKSPGNSTKKAINSTSNKKQSFPTSATGSPTSKYFGGISCTHAASTEIQKRIDKLEKNNIKISAEELARDTKNILIRMPPYKKKDLDIFSSAETDTTFFRMLNKCIFTEGLVDKWKAAS